MTNEELIDFLWGWMPSEQVMFIREDYPEVYQRCCENHVRLWHEEEGAP